MSMFETLSAINVNERTEKKGQLTYLSWSWAWAEFKKACPDATYTIWRDENGLPYTGNPETGYMVYTTVTANEETHEMWLPVMDFKNKALLNATTTDINKAIMRCLTKNLAMFGLGLYIYAGEDLPEEDKAEADRKNALKKAWGTFRDKYADADIEAVKKVFAEIEGIEPREHKAGDLSSMIVQVESIDKLKNLDKAIAKVLKAEKALK